MTIGIRLLGNSIANLQVQEFRLQLYAILRVQLDQFICSLNSVTVQYFRITNFISCFISRIKTRIRRKLSLRINVNL